MRQTQQKTHGDPHTQRLLSMTRASCCAGPSPWVSLWPLPPKAMGMDKRTRPRMGQSRDLRLAKVEGRPWLGCAQSEGLCEGAFPGIVTVCWKVLWATGSM